MDEQPTSTIRPFRSCTKYRFAQRIGCWIERCKLPENGLGPSTERCGGGIVPCATTCSAPRPALLSAGCRFLGEVPPTTAARQHGVTRRGLRQPHRATCTT